MKISAVVIAKNSEDIIADCLDSLGFCDEIVFIDDSSVDRTMEIAKTFTKFVFENPQKSEGFVEAVRKFGISKASCDWVLILDADERITPQLAHEIKEEILKRDSFNAYNIVRINHYLGNNPWPKNDLVLRLFKKSVVENIDWKLHTSPTIEGKIGILKNPMMHYTHQDLSSMLVKTIEWSKLEAKARYDSGHPRMRVWRFPKLMLSAFLRSYVKEGGWKVGSVGLIESVYQSFSVFITYVRLWELQKKGSVSRK